jgi:putative sigma-54 modulation protein
MQIKIVGNFHVANYIKDYLVKKLDKIDKMIGSAASCQANVIHEGKTKDKSYSIELTLFSDKKTYHLELDGKDPLEIIDLLMDKLERQIIKHKEITKMRKRRPNIKNIPFQEEPEEKTIIIQHINPKPLTVKEAIMILEGDKYDFLPFINDDRGQLNVIFKKKNGDYGLYIKKNK